MGRVLPAVAVLRADVMRLLEQAHDGRHPVSMADELEASLVTFARVLGQDGV